MAYYYDFGYKYKKNFQFSGPSQSSFYIVSFLIDCPRPDCLSKEQRTTKDPL